MSLTNSINGDGPQLASDSRRYMYAMELKAGSRTEYTWDPKNPNSLKKPVDPSENEAYRQTLVIRRAIVGPSAKEGESNLISVEIDDDEAEKVSFPMVYLVQGKEPQSIVDLTFPEDPKVTVKSTLTQGTGPVHLVGYHFVERISVDDPDFVCEEEDEDEENEQDDEAECEGIGEDKENKVDVRAIPIRLTTAAKRRLQNGHEELNAKKQKVVADAENEDKKKEEGKEESEDEKMDNETSEPQPESKKEAETAAVEN